MARSLPAASRISPPLLAALASVLLHAGLVIVFIVDGGRREGNDAGETPRTQIAFIAAPTIDHREGSLALASVPVAIIEPPVVEVSVPGDLTIAVAAHEAVPALAMIEPQRNVAAPIEPIPISDEERSQISAHLARAAEQLIKAGDTQLTWQRNDERYRARLVLERAQHGTNLDRVTAEVSAEHHGKPMLMHVKLRRLAFSSYSQIVDRWDSNVQMHDDEIDGRVHINSRFNLMYDGHTAPQLLGKVTTGARDFNLQSNGRRAAREIFRGGIETHAGRIAFPERVHPFAWTSRGNARVHDCVNDTRIFFHPDGSYTWLDIETRQSNYVRAAAEQPVYFIGQRDTTLYVKGVITGDVLVYSPHRVVIEGSLTYAHDPHSDPASHDYLGLVSDGAIEVAPARITGHEDLDIQAAIFARRRFTVTDIEYARSAVLRILGSLSAGTLSATEPRYSTKLEYDTRFEKHRPPGFPPTNRFTVEEWDGMWAADTHEE